MALNGVRFAFDVILSIILIYDLCRFPSKNAWELRSLFFSSYNKTLSFDMSKYQ